MKRLDLFFGSVAVAFASGCGDQPATAPEPSRVTPQLSRARESTLPLTIRVEDPVGDQTGPVDVVRMVMNFDNTTGAYEVVLSAEAGEPFVGAFRINANLFNIDVGTTNPNPSFFSDAVNDFDLSTPTTTITLTGVHPSLLAWNAGQRVFTSSLGGRGNPDGVTLFRSGVSALPLGLPVMEDVIAFASLLQPAVIQSNRHDGGAQRTVVVDQAGGRDATTVQQGIDLVRAGGRVRIRPGTYTERILIYKGLTLDAARSHDDDDDDGEHGRVVIEHVAATPPPPGDAMIRVTTPEAVAIRGLTIRHVGIRGINGTNAGIAVDLTLDKTSFDGPSPVTPPVVSNGVTIANFASLSGRRAKLVVRNSRLETDGIGISVGGDVEVLIEHNVFAVTTSCVVVTGLQAPSMPAATQTDVDIVNNEFTRCGSNRPGFNANGIRVLGLAGTAPTGTVNIIGNTFRNTTRAADDCNATAIHWESHSGRIERNSFINVIQGCAPTSPTERAFPAAIFVGSRIVGILAGSPTVRFNQIVGNAFAGLRIGANQPVAIDARCNWWGSASGPSGVGPGTGDAIIVDAATPLFDPWATRARVQRGHHGNDDNACRGDHDDDDDDRDD